MSEQMHESGGAIDLGGTGPAAGGGLGAATGSRRPLAAFQIIERKGYDRPFWNRIGSAFINRDGSINVFLDSLPLQGKIQLREDTPKEGRESSRRPPDGARAEAE